MLAFALFFSSFSTPYVSGFLTLGVWAVGGLVQNLEAYRDEISGELGRLMSDVIVAIAPDFSLLSLTTQIAYEIPVQPIYVVQATLYAVSYGAFFMVAGSLIFSRRDFI